MTGQPTTLRTEALAAYEAAWGAASDAGARYDVEDLWNFSADQCSPGAPEWAGAFRNGWGEEYIRADFDRAAAALDAYEAAWVAYAAADPDSAAIDADRAVGEILAEWRAWHEAERSKPSTTVLIDRAELEELRRAAEAGRPTDDGATTTDGAA